MENVGSIDVRHKNVHTPTNLHIGLCFLSTSKVIISDFNSRTSYVPQIDRPFLDIDPDFVPS